LSSEKRRLFLKGMASTDELEARLRISKWKLRCFRRYSRRFIAKNFHSVRLLGELDESLTTGEDPVIIAANHPSWWDPLISIYLAETFAGHKQHFAPIENVMLEKYGIFKKLGFFGVEKDTVSGLKDFLKIGKHALAKNSAVMWMTPQGNFSDIRQRPVELKKGISTLAKNSHDVKVLPLALECVFWYDKCPEILLNFGEPVSLNENVHDAITQGLEDVMDELAEASIGRKKEKFIHLLGGDAGVGGVYGKWQKLQGKGAEHRE